MIAKKTKIAVTLLPYHKSIHIRNTLVCYINYWILSLFFPFLLWLDIHTQADDKECDSQEEETPTEECDNNISEKRRRRNSKHDGLLEGISDEDLDDVSDEESGDRKGQSAKLADALGVDWNQLVELKQKQKTLGGEEGHNQESNNEANDKQAQSLARKKRWTPIAIFNRIGLPKSYLSDSFYNSFVQKLNDNAQGKYLIWLS